MTKEIKPSNSGQQKLSKPSKAVRAVCWAASCAIFPAFLLILDSFPSISKWVVSQYEQISLPLHSAASDGYAAKMSRLIAEGEDPELRNSEGETPMHVAVEAGHHSAVDALLAAGADPSADNGWQRTPLHYAARLGHVEIAQNLIDYGAEVDWPGDGGRTPLFLAAEYGHDQVVSVLIDAGAEIDRIYFDVTPLGYAASQGHLSAVKKLIASGAEVNGFPEHGVRPPLSIASGYGRKDVIELLISSGAAVDVRDEFDVTPILSVVSDISHRHRLPEYNESLAVLIDAGADVNHAGGYYKLPPLYWAIIREYHAGISLLLEANVDPDKKFSSETIKEYDVVITRHLTDSASKIKELFVHERYGSTHSENEDRHSISPLHYSISRADFVAAKLLLDAGADIDAQQTNGMTSLHFAIDRYNDRTLVHWLLDHGADPNVQDVSGASPLHYAAFMGYDNSVRMLLDAGADVNAANIMEMTPFDYAGCLKHGGTQELLSIYGATELGGRDQHTVDEVCEILLGEFAPWELRFVAMVSPMIVGISIWDDRISLPRTSPAKLVKDIVRVLCCIEI